jgi:hypothetical protein
LSNAVETFTDVARHAPPFAQHPDEIDQAQWYRLLELAPDGVRLELSHERRSAQIELGW